MIADGTWAHLYSQWVPRNLPPGWKPGSRAVAAPTLPDFAAIAASHPHAPVGPAEPKSTLAQLRDSFFDWDMYRQAIPALLFTGLPNTIFLTNSAAVIGMLLGMALAVAGMSRSRWLRWPARVYTDIFRGLPEVVIILLIGLGVGPLVSGLTHNNPYPLGIAALGLTAAAYIGEILRSGIQSVDPGQLEAARALGFSYSTACACLSCRRASGGCCRRWSISHRPFEGLRTGVFPGPDRSAARAVSSWPRSQRADRQLVTAGGRRAFYLILTVPLTHLVNYIDTRLRRGRSGSSPDEPADTATFGQAMT